MRFLLASVAMSLLLVASTSSAQLNTPLPDIGDGPSWTRELPDNVVRAPGWGDGRPRWFTSGAFDLGFLYIRPRVSFGWGQPHHKWLGIDVNPTVSQNIVGGYGGIRLDHPWANFRFGARYAYPTNRGYLPIKEEYNNRDLETEDTPDAMGNSLGSATYTTIEAELTSSVGVGNGTIFGEFAVSYLTGIPDGFYAYEDTIKIIAAPGWIWRGRVGYEARFGRQDAVGVALVGEVVGNPDRDLTVFRAGVTLRINASPRLQIRGAWIPAIGARDSIGVRGGNFGLLGVRYVWSTGGITGDNE